jgi:hypothetical protein
MIAKTPLALNEPASEANPMTILVREAGAHYQPQRAHQDPIAEWISLMEVVQMLCPAWPVRGKPMLGKQWKL